MKYEINGFEDVFENKNLIQLRKVTRSRGKQIWRAGFMVEGKFYGINFKSLLCDWRFCFMLHKTVRMLWRKQYFIDRFLMFCISSLPSLLYTLWHDGLCIATCGWSAAQAGVWGNTTEQYPASYIFLDRYHLVARNVLFWD